MKVKILSNVVCEPLSKELIKLSPDINIVNYYYEDLILALNTSADQFEDSDFIFIHCDYNFHRVTKSVCHETLDAIFNFCKKIKPYVVISNGFVDGYTEGPLTENLGKQNQVFLVEYELIKNIIGLNNTVFFDYQSVIFEIGVKDSFNYNLGHLYQMPYTKKMLIQFAQKLSNLLVFYKAPEKKVIVIDCDNTLWGGIIGEDGVEGVRCDYNSDGIVYYQFQKFLKVKKDEGFLLCLCSKNNTDDVKELFDSKKMPLKWDDFIVKKINWNDKHLNISEIATELNLGIDSIIFVDDNDFELNSVSEILRGIKTLKFESDYDRFLGLINDYAFKRKFLTKEDLTKTRQYQEEFARAQEMSASSSIEEYIKNMEIKLDIRKNDFDDFVRLAQMTEKTNQFNFNKRIYSVNDLSTFVDSGKGVIYSLKVSDKHGDYGTVGLILIEFEGEHTQVENFLMSCRVLGRRIENDFYNYVVHDLKDRKVNRIRFVKTSKNRPAEEFYKQINL
jgi:FkbH-like protein